MFFHAVFFVTLVHLVTSKMCYWKNTCPYQLYSSKTPYDSIRWDIREYPVVHNCEAVSVWSLNRHGNRNPGVGVTKDIKAIADLKDRIIENHRKGKVDMCAQDIDDLKKWTWNETIEVSPEFLTETGYEELYGIGKRIRENYPHLLEGSDEDYYFRTTNEQRTVVSSRAFVHGLTEGTDLNLAVDGPWIQDDVIRPYKHCDRYQQIVKDPEFLRYQLEDYYRNPEFIDVQNNVQKRLNITLSPDDVYSLYEICRFYRSWEPNLKSPWCAVFTDEELMVLEYKEDLEDYYTRGYGLWLSEVLGNNVVKNLYESMEDAKRGVGKKVIAYFTHNTMVSMTLRAMGMFKDSQPLQGAKIVRNRLWRTSFIVSFAANIVAVLNRCETQGDQTYRVQLFLNEMPLQLCPEVGCDWNIFEEKFRGALDSNLDVCALDDYQGGDGAVFGRSSTVLITSLILALGLS